MEEFPLPPLLRPPVVLLTKVAKVSVVTKPSSKVTEGVKWPVQPKIKVTDANDNPLPGKIVIVYTEGLKSKNFPLLYQNKIGN